MKSALCRVLITILFFAPFQVVASDWKCITRSFVLVEETGSQEQQPAEFLLSVSSERLSVGTFPKRLFDGYYPAELTANLDMFGERAFAKAFWQNNRDLILVRFDTGRVWTAFATCDPI
jgi:hypothetical protein